MAPSSTNPDGTGHGSSRGLLCRKTGRYVDAEHPRCRAPEEPCKYRTECIIYAMEQDEIEAPDSRRGRSYKVTFLPDDRSVTISGGETLLDAARRAGVSLTSPCGGKGACGKCRLILKSGDADSQETPHITEEKRRAGYILACRSRAISDIVVEVPPAGSPGGGGTGRLCDHRSPSRPSSGAVQVHRQRLPRRRADSAPRRPEQR